MVRLGVVGCCVTSDGRAQFYVYISIDQYMELHLLYVHAYLSVLF